METLGIDDKLTNALCAFNSLRFADLQVTHVCFA